MSDDLKNIVEAVLLVSDGPVTVARIQSLFEAETRPEAGRVHEALDALQADCEGRGVELKKIGSGYRYQTDDRYADYLRKLHAVKPPRLSRALLETLAIVAYRQPVTRGDIEEVRGVAVSTDIMQRLIEREWVKEVGVRDVPGRPALFGTTPEFLSYFNLESLKELPDLMDQRALGDIAGEMDTPLPAELLAALEADTETDDIEEEGPLEEQGVMENLDDPSAAEQQNADPVAESSDSTQYLAADQSRTDDAADGDETAEPRIKRIESGDDASDVEAEQRGLSSPDAVNA